MAFEAAIAAEKPAAPAATICRSAGCRRMLCSSVAWLMLAGVALVPFAPAWAVGYEQDSRFPANPPLAHVTTEASAKASQYGFDLLTDVEIGIGSCPKPARDL